MRWCHPHARTILELKKLYQTFISFYFFKWRRNHSRYSSSAHWINSRTEIIPYKSSQSDKSTKQACSFHSCIYIYIYKFVNNRLSRLWKFSWISILSYLSILIATRNALRFIKLDINFLILPNFLIFCLAIIRLVSLTLWL